MHKQQYLFLSKIISTIKSCKTIDQLENAHSWYDTVTYNEKLPVSLTIGIEKAYRDKKQQIQNGLAIKYVDFNNN